MGKRYACFTEEQQGIFDGLKPMHQKYIVLRGAGHSKVEAYKMAGYKGKASAQSAYDLEVKRVPVMVELIGALSGQRQKMEVFNEQAKIAKEIERKAKEKGVIDEIASSYVPKVAESAPVAQPIDLHAEIEKMSIDQVQNLQFWREVAMGKIVTEKETKTYDKEGKLTGRKVEKVKDVNVRMKAQEMVTRILNIEEVMELGTIQVPNVNIMIVDARKKEPDILEGKTEIYGEQE